MGMDATALLYYGYSFGAYGDDAHQPWEGDSNWDWTEALAASQGVFKPTAEFDSNNPEVMGEYHAYWQRRNDIEAASPVVMERAGSGDSDMDIIVCIRASLIKAEWDRPKDVPEKHQVYQAGWDGKLNDFCTALGIDRPLQAPSWQLAARYW